MWLYGVLLFAGFIGCKTPSLFVANTDNWEGYDCEVLFFKNEKPAKDLSNLATFKTEFKQQIIKQARECKCDALIIDLNNIYNTKKETQNQIWGVCKSN